MDTLECGKPIAQARGEIEGAADIWRYAAALARELSGESYSNLGSDRIGFVLREPIGVVSIITPWNFPLLIVSLKLPFALAAGCAARVLLGKPYDADGAGAARGKVDEELLSRLLEHDFFHRRPPRSAWRLDFGSSFAENHIAQNPNLTPQDLLATFTEFTAVSVSRSIRDHIPILGEIST